MPAPNLTRAATLNTALGRDKPCTCQVDTPEGRLPFSQLLRATSFVVNPLRSASSLSSSSPCEHANIVEILLAIDAVVPLTLRVERSVDTGSRTEELATALNTCAESVEDFDCCLPVNAGVAVM